MQLFIITAMLAVTTSVCALPQPQTSEENEVCTRTCFSEAPECGGTFVSFFGFLTLPSGFTDGDDNDAG
jgi:hypothetical protein